MRHKNIDNFCLRINIRRVLCVDTIKAAYVSIQKKLKENPGQNNISNKISVRKIQKKVSLFSLFIEIKYKTEIFTSQKETSKATIFFRIYIFERRNF